MNKEELRLEIHAQVNSAAQKQVNAAYTGQTSPIDTAVNVDAIMALFDTQEPSYEFKFDTYFGDDTGYAVVTHPHAPITVIASSKEEALKKVWAAFEGAKYKHNWSLRASLESARELPATPKQPTNGDQVGGVK